MNKLNKKLALCVISGGMDSTLSSYLIKNDGYDIIAVHFNYNQRTQTKELKCFNDICDRLEVKENYAKIISNNKDSLRLKEILDNIGMDAYNIVEFGIGTNPNAKITGIVLEDEKVRGTVHFALGNDLSYGRKNDVPIHLDGIVKEPTIIVDKRIIMKNGKFILR